MKENKVVYLEDAQITTAKRTETPTQRTVSGYGNKLPTSYMLRVCEKVGTARWRRVYCICYSNVGSLYVKVADKRLFIRNDEHLRHLADEFEAIRLFNKGFTAKTTAKLRGATQ